MLRCTSSFTAVSPQPLQRMDAMQTTYPPRHTQVFGHPVVVLGLCILLGTASGCGRSSHDQLNYRINESLEFLYRQAASSGFLTAAHCRERDMTGCTSRPSPPITALVADVLVRGDRPPPDTVDGTTLQRLNAAHPFTIAASADDCLVHLFTLHQSPDPRTAVAAVRRVQDLFTEERFHSCSTHYPTPHSALYALAYAYSQLGVPEFTLVEPPVRDTLVALQQGNGRFGNTLETSLAITSLLWMGEVGAVVDRGVDWLMLHRNADGSWPMALLYVTSIDGKQFYVGSRTATTALALEAILQYRTMRYGR